MKNKDKETLKNKKRLVTRQMCLGFEVITTNLVEPR